MSGWRLYQALDRRAVDALHVEMKTRVGMEFELPDLEERPVMLALVYEKHGIVTHAAFLEAVGEIATMGEKALPRKEWEKASAMFSELCNIYELHTVRAFVPNSVLFAPKSQAMTPIERMLRYFGFVREDPALLTPFTRQMAAKIAAGVIRG